jgi:hypothetical protein
MDNANKPSESEFYSPSSEPFRCYLNKHVRQTKKKRNTDPTSPNVTDLSSDNLNKN